MCICRIPKPYDKTSMLLLIFLNTSKTGSSSLFLVQKTSWMPCIKKL